MSHLSAAEETRDWDAPRFERSEYQRRIDRVREECERRKLAGLLLYSQESLYYLFGYDQLGYWVYQVAFLPTDGRPPVVICRAADEWLVRKSSFLDDVRVWYDDSPETPDAMTWNILRECGLTLRPCVIGAELNTHALLPSYYEALQRSVPDGIQMVDASDVVGDMRIFKSPAEVAYFRRAASYLQPCFDAARRAIQPGVRETDVHAAIMSTMYLLGADTPAIPPPIMSGPRTLAQTHSLATRRRMEIGDPVVIEIGTAESRYHAVGVQAFVVGQPDAELVEVHDVIVGALDAGFEVMEPGVPVGRVVQAVRSFLNAKGHSRAGRHIGYGTGIGYPPSWLENLRVKMTDARSLSPGMTLFYYIGLVVRSGRHYLYLGEPVLITDDGYERIARPDYENWIL